MKWTRINLMAQKQNAFTVPELLAVVAVIAILIAILLPSMQRAREVTRNAICLSNLHQMAIGTSGYCVEERYLPASFTTGITLPAQPYSLRGVREACAVWPGQIRSYASDSTEMFYCPVARKESRWSRKLGSGNPAMFGYLKDEYWVSGHFTGGTSYGMNNDGSRTHPPTSTPSLGMSNLPGYSAGYIRRSSVKSPSNFLMYGDSLLDDYWDAFIDYQVPREEMEGRHFGRANVAYMDGHAVQVDPRDYALPTAWDPAKLRQWNNDDQFP